jgi:hypothetical protein
MLKDKALARFFLQPLHSTLTVRKSCGVEGRFVRHGQTTSKTKPWMREHSSAVKPGSEEELVALVQRCGRIG